MKNTTRPFSSSVQRSPLAGGVPDQVAAGEVVPQNACGYRACRYRVSIFRSPGCVRTPSIRYRAAVRAVVGRRHRRSDRRLITEQDLTASISNLCANGRGDMTGTAATGDDRGSDEQHKKGHEWYIETGMNVSIGVGIIVLAKAVGAGPFVRSLFFRRPQSGAVGFIGDVAVGLFYDFFPAVFVIWVFGLYLLGRSVAINGSVPTDEWWIIDVWVSRIAFGLAVVLIILGLI